MKRSVLFRFIALFCTSVIFGVLLVGCVSEVPTVNTSVGTEESIPFPEFESLGSYDVGSRHFILYRDSFTDLLYLCLRYKDGYAGGISLIPYYDTDGSHMTYSRFLSINDEIGG